LLACRPISSQELGAHAAHSRARFCSQYKPLVLGLFSADTTISEEKAASHAKEGF